MEKITVFNAKKTKNKHPFSPYDDNTFIFETYPVESNTQLYTVMVSHFILNIPLGKLEAPVRTFRRKANINQYYEDTISYLVLDIDKVTSEENKQVVLNYFNKFKVILGESKSYNSIDNFNMKGILFIEPLTIDDAKLALSFIHHELKDICEIDESVTRRASLNAPIQRNKIFINNETGPRFSFQKPEAIQKIEAIKKDYIKSEVTHNIDVSELDNLEADTMPKLCLQVYKSMGFIATQNQPNGAISFKHPNESKSPGGYFWFETAPYTMHHPNSTKTVNIFDVVRKLPAAKEILRKEINYDNEFLQFNTDTSVITVNEKYLAVTDVIRDGISEFISQPDGLLSIRSPMGTGKSTIINHVIEECHEEDMRVLIITNRISVANDFGKKYNIKLYTDGKYDIGDSLICQYDSLWKYDLKKFDIVIMDEFISLMMHSRSNLNNSSMNIAKFFASFDKKLVIADAFLTGYENFLLSNKTENMFLIDNTYRDPTILYSYDNANYFIQNIKLHAKNHKVTVSATSLSFINSLQMFLTDAGLNVVTLTAETPESTKKLIYELFEQNDHDKWDVLIFSPTLTVGVSNLNDVPYHFHYDSSMSTDVVSSIQMIKRTRKSREIHFCVKEKINFIKTNYNDLRDEVIANIGRNVDRNYLFDIDNYGEPKLSWLGKKALKIDTFKNIMEFNHKEGLLWLLKYHFLYDPIVIEKKFEGNSLWKYTKMMKNDRQILLQNNIKQFLKLNSMERTSLILDTDADKLMVELSNIDVNIKDCNEGTKIEILEIALGDRGFIQKCKYYNMLYMYTKKFWEESDLRMLVSKAVMQNNSEELQFINALSEYGQGEIFTEYYPKAVNKNRKLKHLLDACGYKIRNTGLSSRNFAADPNVLEYYRFIK